MKNPVNGSEKLTGFFGCLSMQKNIHALASSRNVQWTFLSV